MKKKISQLTKIERIVVAFLVLIAVIVGYQIVYKFYDEYTDMAPVAGGVYTEGVVGKLGAINPLFVQQGSVSDDLTQLIFSGLSRYSPSAKEIVPDLADFQMDVTGKEYTFVIKQGAKWHDGQPVTSEDVIFTYETVLKHPLFNGVILRYNDYTGIKVAKIDERTVKFFLEKPDSFFPAKTMVGILPAHLLSNVPVDSLTDSFFNQSPIGTGRFRFVAIISTTNQLEVSLEAFNDFYDSPPHIKNILIKVFPTEEDLEKHLGELDGVRNVSEKLADKILKKNHLILYRYHLPQYVAAFINTESPKLKNNKVRLALQLGTDKASLTKAINETRIIDTPLLEIDQENWMNQYSVTKANGALFDTEWKLPNKSETIETDETPNLKNAAEEKKEDSSNYINGPNDGKDFETTENKVVITGTAPLKTKEIMVNDYVLKKYVPGDKGWSYIASTEFDSLKKGENIYNVYRTDFEGNKELLDSITITYGEVTFFAEQDKAKREEENKDADTLPIRINQKDETLTLRMIIPETPATYTQIATLLQEQWRKIGVAIEIHILENEAFQKSLNNRDYDLLIFGQNLGYNLDAYPYWHSSQAKPGGYNLSQFKNFVADSLLQEARFQHDVERRKKTLNDLQKIINTEVPAIFLYSPTYILAQSKTIQNTSFDHLATTSDHFSEIDTWYARVDRQLKEGVTPLTFLGWLVRQF
ncbi:hypothetical protein COY07_04620 [Candidatus Peregrinibacteria bacterium CG_4_10_14_0_2_um_filter_43_11]|nr:MAG: hypothetical protein COY07_04620 [Candidatus Peregrinibacteria bacterium CG_4_10_14_0_2_um_filter_43_11]